MEDSDLWNFVKVRDIWNFDISALIVEADDGQPYCEFPRYNSYLGGLRSPNSILVKLARSGNSTGAQAEVLRDILRRITGVGLVLSRIKNAILRSSMAEALWRFKMYMSHNPAAVKGAALGIATRLTQAGIRLRFPSSFIESDKKTGALSCNYEVWIACLSSWLVYYMQYPSHDKLFGSEQMVDKNEVSAARSALGELVGDDLVLNPRPRRNEFNANEVASILCISPLAAACLWSIVQVACTGSGGPLQQIGISADSRESVVMKYSLGKLLLYRKGTLLHVTRQFGKDISRAEFLSSCPPGASDSSLCISKPSQKCFRDKYLENQGKHVFELPDPSDVVEAFECKYITECSGTNETSPKTRIADEPQAFFSFKSLATLSAFQIDIAEVSKTDGKLRTVLLNRSFGKSENAITEAYRSMLRKMQITPDALISGVSNLSAALLWILILLSFGFGLVAATRKNLRWEDRIDAVVKVSGPVFLLLVTAEYLSVHDNYVKVLLTSTIEIKKMSCLARFLGLSYNETLWLVATDPRPSRILHSHGTGFLRNTATGPLVLDRISRPRETVGSTSVWGEKFIVDEHGVRALDSQPDGKFFVKGLVDISQAGLVVISLEGSRQIRGTTSAP